MVTKESDGINNAGKVQEKIPHFMVLHLEKWLFVWYHITEGVLKHIKAHSGCVETGQEGEFHHSTSADCVQAMATHQGSMHMEAHAAIFSAHRDTL